MCLAMVDWDCRLLAESFFRGRKAEKGEEEDVSRHECGP
jgi:hypothetical protein